MIYQLQGKTLATKENSETGSYQVLQKNKF